MPLHVSAALTQRILLAVTAIGLALTGCGNEAPVELGDTSPGPTAGRMPQAQGGASVQTPGAGGTVNEPNQAGSTPGGSPTPMMPVNPPDAMGGTPQNIEIIPDRELFESEVLPIVFRRCGSAGCHGRRDADLDDNFYAVVGTAASPAGEDIEKSFQEFIMERIIDYRNPPASQIFAYHEMMPNHPGLILRGSNEYNILIGWIEASVKIVEPPTGGEAGPDTGGAPTGPGAGGDVGGAISPEMPPMSGGDAIESAAVPCDGLPPGDGVGVPGWRDSFEAEKINELLVGTPQEPNKGLCSGGSCHTVQGNGLWLLGPEDPCSENWNFAFSQFYVNPRRPLESELLIQPLGEVRQDPNNPMHGGRIVFQGREDPNYIKLSTWIRAGLTP